MPASQSLFRSILNIVALLSFILIKSADSIRQSHPHHHHRRSSHHQHHAFSSAHCPSSCYDEAAGGGKWSAYHELDQLSMCNAPMLLDFNVHNAFNSPDTHNTVFACSTGLASSIFVRDEPGNGISPNNTTACGIPLTQNTPSHFNIIRSGSPNSTNSETDAEALLITKYQLSHKETTCNSTTSFIVVGDSVVGVYAGASVPPAPFAEHVLQALIADIKAHGATDSVYVESCNEASGLSTLTMGVVIGNFTTIPLVQSAVSAWSNGGCMTTNSTKNSTSLPWESFDLPLLSHPPLCTNKTVQLDLSRRGGPRLLRRGDCSTVQVKSGDSCASLATECGISGADFTKYNSDPSLCSKLTPGQHVCCSPGSLPDFAPKPQADGTCATHVSILMGQRIT